MRKTSSYVEMDGSWLIQRLQKPRRPHPAFGTDNPFAFGGGLLNGGLNAEAMGLLRSIFSFDYMGAAEFEFGAVPKALQAIARDARNLTAFSFDVALADVPPSWQDKSKTAPEGSAPIYVLCPSDHAAEVKVRIRTWATEQYPRLKESTHLPRTLRPYSEWDGETVGWLELDNGFFFFTDPDMWSATASLFGVETPERAA